MNETRISYTELCQYESIKTRIRDKHPLTQPEFEIVQYGDVWFLIDIIAIYNQVIIGINPTAVHHGVSFTDTCTCESVKHHVRNIQPLSYSELEFTSNAEIPFLLDLICVYNQVIIDHNESYIVTIDD